MTTLPSPSVPSDEEHHSSSPWHTLPVDQACDRLESSVEGLTAQEAHRRLDLHGLNELETADRVSSWSLLLEQFKNVLIIILLIATALSAVLGHALESAVIAVIVVFAIVLGFLQEQRAERALESLRRMAAPSATVLRDQTEMKKPARELVPGDVILLQAGDKVPADVRLIQAVNMQVEEAALTGESMPVEKGIDPLVQAKLSVGDRTNMAYMGTAVTYGRGRGLVVGTGMKTEFGQIARMLQTVEVSRTPLQVNLDKVGRNLSIAALAIVSIIVILGLVRGQPFLEMLIFGIALAVAVVPEALPAVVTVSLAIGVQRMAKRNALMRRLPAVETLGSTTVICSDKTGTLTKDEMTVRKILVNGQLLDVSGSGYTPTGGFSLDGEEIEPTAPLRRLLKVATLASDARLVPGEIADTWDILGDPTEGALVVAAAKIGIEKAALNESLPRVHEIPFTSETKRMTTLHEGDGEKLTCCKGAPEVILQSCSRLLTLEGEIPLESSGREQILQSAKELASQALRVLAIASKAGTDPDNAESEMIFLGLVGMIDPPRPEAREAVATCKDAGIRVVMITGDHPITAQAIAAELGILTDGRVVTGHDVEAMNDTELEQEAEKIQVYARVSPAHKLRVVTALQKRGHITAMTGDGVNDAPALKKADIGIAMGITGTDVTREASAMTLTDDNFASIVAAVEEGRGLFSNIKKYLMYLLSANVGEIGLMSAAALFGMPLPLSAVQILYVNLATDGLPALALAVDPPEKDLMQRRPRNPRKGIFTRPVLLLMLVSGFWLTAVNFGLFAWALQSGRSLEQAMAMVFVTLVLMEFCKAYNFRSDRHTVLRSPFNNKWLNLAILWEILLLVAVVYVPFLQHAFNIFALSLHDWIIAVCLALTVVPVVELLKWIIRRRFLKSSNAG